MHAERKGATLGIQTDDGWITESAVSCVGFVIDGAQKFYGFVFAIVICDFLLMCEMSRSSFAKAS